MKRTKVRLEAQVDKEGYLNLRINGPNGGATIFLADDGFVCMVSMHRVGDFGRSPGFTELLLPEPEAAAKED